MHQTAIKPQTKLETLRSIYTLVFQKRLTTTKISSPYKSVNFGNYGNYGNVGNYGNPGNYGSIGLISGYRDIEF